MIVSESTTEQTIENVNERRQEAALKKAKTYLEKIEPIKRELPRKHELPQLKGI